MNKDAFSWFHPVVNLAFFLAALGMTMLVQHPVYLLISFAENCSGKSSAARSRSTPAGRAYQGCDLLPKIEPMIVNASKHMVRTDQSPT